MLTYTYMCIQVDASQLAGLGYAPLCKTAREIGVILTNAMTKKPNPKDKLDQLRLMAKEIGANVGHDVQDKKTYVRAIEEKQVLVALCVVRVNARVCVFVFLCVCKERYMHATEQKRGSPLRLIRVFASLLIPVFASLSLSLSLSACAKCV